MDVDDAKRTWEAMNGVESLTDADDHRFAYDDAVQQSFRDTKPWTRDPNYFTKVHVSAVALIKMVIHARSGGSVEIMGSLQGKVAERAFVIMDVFPLPVEGTETRVSAHSEGNEFMVAYQEKYGELGRKENIVGWYHSHPGYGCWLSGIDVQTQLTNQQYQDPFVAIVVDPVRTMSAGKVDIGAFRTYPAGHTADDEGPSEYQTIPLEKIEDFGVHCKNYYPLKISCFKSSLDSRLLDLLWNKYWASTLSSSPLLDNRAYIAGQVTDLAAKVGKVESQPQNVGRVSAMSEKSKRMDERLTQVTKDAQKVAVEQMQGMINQALKNSLFRSV